jgi:Reverse transcriptase (RNA-dependent DNA polymerase)
VSVRYQSKQHHLTLIVVDSTKNFAPLLGRDWLDSLFPAWRNFFQEKMINNISKIGEINIDGSIDFIRKKYVSFFDNDLSSPIKAFKVNIQLKEGAIPIFHKAYSLPFSLREKVSNEIEKLCEQNILIPVSKSEWASPIVVVRKDDSKIRMCVDFSITLNKCLKTEHYPLPVIDEILSNLVGSKFFCILDMKGAYTQLEVAESSQELLTINTIKGLFQFTRLPFGIKPAAGIFQSVMDNILKGLKNVFCYINDVLIGDASILGLQKKIILVLDKLSEYNIKINWQK